MLEAASQRIKIGILVGNHDLINEKGSENSLNFLSPYARIICSTCSWEGLNFVPYQPSPEEFLKQISRHEGVVICHQGVLGAYMGEYIQDKSSVNPIKLKNHIVISGHYHRHQTVGTITYIGTPYTTSFAEANDPAKGFLTLNYDGTFVRHLTNLRRHTIIECLWNEVSWLNSDRSPYTFYNDDLLWLKVSGPQSELKKLNKTHIGYCLLGHSNFKLDLIATDKELSTNKQTHGMSNTELLDMLIGETSETKEQKIRLKETYHDLLTG